MSGSLYLGVDVGASATKALIINNHSSIVGRAVVSSGMDFKKAAKQAVEIALSSAGSLFSEIKFIVSTGYGRERVDFAGITRTEISCHGHGAYHFFPEKITVVDIGGQDNKIIKLKEDGKLLDFKMNRKCAAGTGAFIEEIARRIGLDKDEMEKFARLSRADVKIGSFCTVFSFTEILTMIKKGIKIPDIVKAVFRSVVKRIMEMDSISGKIVATGGVVEHNPIIVELLSEACMTKVFSPPMPQFTGAMGAALFALRKYQMEKYREKEVEEIG